MVNRKLRILLYTAITVLSLFVVYGSAFFIADILIKNDIKKAYNGDGIAQMRVGNMYYNGILQPMDCKKALAWFIKAGDQGYLAAQYNAGYIYETVYDDNEAALEWYLRAAKHNYSPAQNKVGIMYLHGLGVTKDYPKAIEWFQKAIKQGSIHAQSNLGAIYMDGLGVDNDYEKAYQLSKEAAEKGVANAQYNLGLIYLNGLGVAKNESTALKWVEKSIKNSSRENADIQYRVGLMYEHGTNIAKTKDIVKAKKLYTKAAKQGHVCAKHRLEEISEEHEPPILPPL